ncbi:PP2C family protein-serine/threonine phosphatase [Pokkaliibacter plantistimulans]|nr:protein phosphatase 2C domain-containing protein [Pokkaliibacter plantistimulans]
MVGVNMVMGAHPNDMQLVSFAQSHKGKIRDHNEDAYLELAECGVWVVADGMGGHAAGDVASQMVVDTLEMELAHLPRHQISVEQLVGAIRRANRNVQHYASTQMQGKTVGSTVVALLVRNEEYHLCWVGDSRAYLLRDGQLQQCTRDHSQVQDMVEQGLISRDDAEFHPLANVVTRAIGGQEEVEVDVVSGLLQPGDLFLLCSDGLSKELSFHQLSQILNTPSVVDACMALTHSALVHGGRDNITSVLVRACQGRSQGELDDPTLPLVQGHWVRT